MKRYGLWALVGFILVIVAPPLLFCQTSEPGSGDQLQQLTALLQQSPADEALREKIIKLAQDFRAAPAIPEEARRSFVRGNTAFSEAKGPDDYARAVQRYEEAIAIAPWWGDPYFNLAKALELRQEYSRAIHSIKLYILTGPSGDDARKAQDYSYVLEDKQDKLTTERSKQEAAARAEEVRYGWLMGRWKYVMEGSNAMQVWTGDGIMVAKREGNQVEFRIVQGTTHFRGEDSPLEDYFMANGYIRATVSPSGEIIWEGRSDDAARCPVTWSLITPIIGSDHRTITFEQQRRISTRCTWSGRDQYTLRRE